MRHPVESGELDIVDSLPRAVLSNDLACTGRHRFGQRVVIGIAPASNRGLDPGFGEPLRVADRQILAAAVAVMNQTVGVGARPKGLLVQCRFSEFMTRQPTIFRENTSMTKAT